MWRCCPHTQGILTLNLSQPTEVQQPPAARSHHLTPSGLSPVQGHRQHSEALKMALGSILAPVRPRLTFTAPSPTSFLIFDITETPIAACTLHVFTRKWFHSRIQHTSEANQRSQSHSHADLSSLRNGCANGRCWPSCCICSSA